MERENERNEVIRKRLEEEANAAENAESYAYDFQQNKEKVCQNFKKFVNFSIFIIML